MNGRYGSARDEKLSPSMPEHFMITEHAEGRPKAVITENSTQMIYFRLI